jgi:hypothetical protein
MSGFLRNLSARALGESAPVQSAARLPYAALPETFEPPVGDQTGSPLAVRPVASVAAPTNAADRTVRSEPGMPRGMPPLLVPHPHDDAGNDDAGDEPFPPRAMRAPADPEPVASPLTRLVAFEPAEPVAPAREPTPPPLVPIATRFVPPPMLAPAPPALTSVPPGRASAPPARSASMAGVHRHATSEPTEVHVSIGRIELTAVHEAPPPARRPAPAKPSLPLHEYLARRQRRPS